jgi:hypothetical protein
MSRARLLARTLCLALLLGAPPASGFCRKTTCSDCPVNPVTGCIEGGAPLVWPRACVSYALTRAASRNVGLAEAKIVAAEAFQTWQSVTCPGTTSPPSIVATDAFGIADCPLLEYNRGAGNANIIVFRDDVWEHDNVDALGLTSMTFNDRTGEIVDADIEVNSTLPITTSTEVPPGGWDLASILTHEAGHFLGLGHSTVADATMYPFYRQGSDDFRTLSDDDVAGICAIYPPDRAALPCDFTPAGGFASRCALGITKGGCVLGRGPVAPGAWYAFAALSFLSFTRRRSRRSSGS